MKEEKRSFHKKRKWVCPKCGKVVMEETKKKKKEERGRF
jgi:ribosomal protein S27AE